MNGEDSRLFLGKAPIDLLYSQVERCLREGNTPSGLDAMAGLLSMLEPIKTQKFRKEMETIRKEGKPEDMFYKQMKAIFKLMKSKKIWTFHQIVRRGTEMLQGL